ncbi:GTPase HRas-like [Ylistrum balloti]|uniref:GTPase HRas-like n=1 Tax=Ylistrum balloti TaxID=509963 RepID=UPI002905BEAE|nr:GTPase HRas-like [Ylistrum balloti]
MAAQLKLVVIGSSGVRKSALCIQYVQNYFVEDIYPTIEDLYTKKCVVNGVSCTIEVIDTSGRNEFSIMRQQNIVKADGILYIFNLHEEISVENVEKDMAFIRRIKDVPVIFVGNQCDISVDSGVDELISYLAATHCVQYMKTSAKTSEGVEEAFSALVTTILAQKAEDLTISTHCSCLIL